MNRPSRRFGLKRKERGATIVLVTLSMVALLGMAAVSIDFAVASEQKSSVQNAADAAALAVAADCAQNKAKCGPGHDADWYAKQAAGASATVQTLKDGVVKSPAYADRKVTVRVSKNIEHTFARVLGEGAGTVQAEATASWNSVPLRASKMVPIGLPYCMWKDYNPISGVGSKKGATVEFVWSTFRVGETSCAGLSGVTAPTVYGRAATSSSNLAGAGRAVYFTPDVVPGLTFTCSFAPSVWDVYRDDLANWSVVKYDSCMNNQFKKPDGSAVGPGDILMFPIYAVEKKTFFFDLVKYDSRVVIIGFAPFQIQDFVKYPSVFFGQEPGRESILDLLDPKASHDTSCTFGWSVGVPNVISVGFGGSCGGIRGKFVQSTNAALFKDFTEFGSYYANPDSGLAGDAPQLGGTRVTLVK
ncbi:hypothetical protein IBG24_08510 [Aeromicrobium sp. zg-636]|uniref:Putative Flp pilus-assembly TadG-like N-terminal domain-containing protein n=1 Tax=Aeromicrobium senzhongii TaxID=2663859 RepID=A0A8I0EWK0_9ACTN|nr:MULTISPECIES: pilus assembly protein TadG-related protein [Aeromicrobium]MBC9226355.1 hypothetical protein [Aeromicrobium senzhongii]